MATTWCSPSARTLADSRPELSLRALDLDIFDAQSRFVAVAAERLQDLADCVVDLLGAGRLLVCFHSRFDHGLFWRGIELRGVQLGHGEASVLGLPCRDDQFDLGVEVVGAASFSVS